MTQAARSAEYNRIYDEGTRLFASHNPCQIQRDADGRVSCRESREGTPEARGSHNYKHLCCTGCQHLGPNGCRVKAISCKLWTCRTIQTAPEHRELMVSLDELKKQAQAIGVGHYVRATKTQELRWGR